MIDCAPCEARRRRKNSKILVKLFYLSRNAAEEDRWEKDEKRRVRKKKIQTEEIYNLGII
jgi:hypothetical protein